MIPGLFSLLSTAPSLSSLGTRIYPLTLPDPVILPAATMTIVSSVVSPSFTTRGPLRTRLQVNIFAATYADASSTRDALVDLLHGWTGTLSDGTFVRIKLIQFIDMPFSSEALQFRLSAEFYIFSNL